MGITVNPIVIFNWVGFSSDSATLMRNGWEVAVSEDPMAGRYMFALKHQQLNMYGASSMYDGVKTRFGSFAPPLEVSINAIAPSNYFRILHEHPNAPFIQVSSGPQVMTFAGREVDGIASMRYFRSDVIDDKGSLIVEPESVPKLLEKIKALQSPKQAEIREKRRRELHRMIRGGSAEILPTHKVLEVCTTLAEGE